MKSLAIGFGSIALVIHAFSLAAADDRPWELSSAHLASMGLSGMQPMPDAAGDIVIQPIVKHRVLVLDNY